MQFTVLISLAVTVGRLLQPVLSFSPRAPPVHRHRVGGAISSGLALTAETSTSDGASNELLIEYCTGCRWMLRAAWMAQELLTTFEDDNLSSITLVPTREPAGVFCVRSCDDSVLLWDRKAEGGFPEAKQLKQRVRDWIAPDKDLGHSDAAAAAEKATDCETCPDPPPPRPLPKLAPNLSITYCTGCRWLLRAAWMAQELLTTFETEINSVTLVPNDEGGVYRIELDESMLWDRKKQERFPAPKEIKQKVRDVLNPERSLGHSDVTERTEAQGTETSQDAPTAIDDMTDDEAEEMRKFFGVM
eukprot:CAMPEP_0194031408 /NCGR_PEP_ID=MMETSP0009_2-20130614/4589_1 /TAXON_ID=210454 /ORGANISM="Grammatophora oceanica, Strain CCMP 410" /LENGTH=301 /DNA_ID=CAMNT_0038671551 /DNA_START=116 /DNA_END=1021 /DNA_ORIENTATION=+